MTRKEPADPGWWIQAAYATRRSQSIEEAERVLRDAVQRHPSHGLILYNLACYACVQGNLDEARERMALAIAVHPEEMLAMARKDPDLESIRPWIVGKVAEFRDL